MKFDLDYFINENKERLKFEQETIRSLQTSYGYFVIYISFLGLTFFDFLKFLRQVNSAYDYICAFFMVISFMMIGITTYNFIRLFIPREVAYDQLPSTLKDYYEEIDTWAKKENRDSEKEFKIAYNELLNEAVTMNFNLYVFKRNLLNITIKFALFSLVPYFISMTMYKLYY